MISEPRNIGCVNTTRSGESAYHEFAGVNDSVSLEFMDGPLLPLPLLPHT